MIEFFEKMTELLTGNVPFVMATIVDGNGSIPQEIGAKMLVVDEGLYFGTVGGGKVETRAIKEAQALLGTESGDLRRDKQGRITRTMLVSWSLDRDIGMTCGGSVKVYFEAYNTNPWRITIFGAGHCSGALIDLLIRLECRITCIDPREQWLERLPKSSKLITIQSPDMPGQVSSIAADSFVVLMTMGHTTDKPILLEILRNWKDRQFPYLGVIGSQAKAVRLKRDITDAGMPESYHSLFLCPMGLDIGSNQPAEIAISIAAQLLQKRDLISPPAAEAAPIDCAEPTACV